jgi:hypothetical protein
MDGIMGMPAATPSAWSADRAATTQDPPSLQRGGGFSTLITAGGFAVGSSEPNQEVPQMSYTLEQFSAECHRILKQDPGVEGRKQVCALVQQVLTDAQFISAHLGDDVPERKVLYEDPELGFCILGHVYHGAKDSNPHDHGPSWAIYGQARGQTVMTDYFPVARPGEGKPGKARPTKEYTLTPGAAYLYNEGDLRRQRPRRARVSAARSHRLGVSRLA